MESIVKHLHNAPIYEEEEIEVKTLIELMKEKGMAKITAIEEKT